MYKDERTKYTVADGLGSDEVRAILEDRSGDLWVGTLGGGVSRLHNGRFTTWGVTNGLPSNNVWALHEDPDGVLWMGTDNGLCRFQDGQVTTFTKAQGLPDSLVNLIIGDDFGRLWIGHDRGIYSLQRQQLQDVSREQGSLVQAVQYDESDGLLSPETNGQKSYPAACRTRDGRLWFRDRHRWIHQTRGPNASNRLPAKRLTTSARSFGPTILSTTPWKTWWLTCVITPRVSLLTRISKCVSIFPNPSLPAR